MKLLLAVLAVLIPAMAKPAAAGQELRVGTNLLVDDNIFRNYSGQGDVVFIPYADLGYGFLDGQEQRLLLNYQGDFYLFNELSRRDFSVHSLGGDYTRLWPDSRRQLSLGGRIETRLNPEDYRYYDYNSGGLYLNLKQYLRDNVVLTARYNLAGRSFDQFPEFNYAENVFALQTSISLPSRTTLQLSTSYYHKNYTQSVNSMDSVFIPQQSASEHQTPPVMGGGHGRGWWRRQQQTVVQPGGAGGYYIYHLRSDEFASTDQFRLGVTVAQNLADGTGLSVGFATRLNPHNRNRYLANLGENMLNNEELFDDHYSYLGHEGTVQLKQVLPGESLLTMLVTARERRYSGRPAMTLEGEPLTSGASRLDRALLFETIFTRPFSFGQHLEDFELSAQFGLGRNSSNDSYYDHRSAYFALALEKAF